MTKRYSGVLGFFMLVGITGVYAAEPAASDSTEVHFAVSNQTLTAALTELKAQSGLEYSVTPEVEADVLTMDLHDKNWPSLVRRLLSGYNYVSQFDPKSGSLKVLISSRGKERVTTTAAVAVSD